jgi:transposase-like protein
MKARRRPRRMRYSLESRLRVVELVEQLGVSPAAAAAAAGASRASGYRWWRRYRAGGWQALVDRASTPKRQPRRLTVQQEAEIVAARRASAGPARIGALLGQPASTARSTRGRAPHGRAPRTYSHRLRRAHRRVDHRPPRHHRELLARGARSARRTSRLGGMDKPHLACAASLLVPCLYTPPASRAAHLHSGLHSPHVLPANNAFEWGLENRAVGSHRLVGSNPTPAASTAGNACTEHQAVAHEGPPLARADAARQPRQRGCAAHPDCRTTIAQRRYRRVGNPAERRAGGRARSARCGERRTKPAQAP